MLIDPDRPISSTEIETLQLFIKAGPRGLTLNELAWALHCSRRVAQRRVHDELERSGTTFRDGLPREDSNEQVLVLDVLPRWAVAVVGRTELTELFAAARGPEAPALRRIALTLEVLLAERNAREAEFFRRRIRTTAGGRPGLEAWHEAWPMDSIREAIQDDLVLRARLRPHPGETRDLLPYALVTDHASGQVHLLGMAYHHGEEDRVEAWPLGRIVDLETLGRRRPISREGREALERAIEFSLAGVFSGAAPFTVRLRLRGPAVEAFRTDRLPLPELEVSGDGTEASFRTNTVEGAARWVLGFGPGATVRDPPELVAAVTSALREGLDAYD